jgi:hypothetical protein
MTSLVSLPRVPMELMPSAMVPATGPSPKIGIMMTMAQISSGMARMPFRTWRTPKTTGLGDTFSAARNPSGREIAAPIMVPIHAMCSDSIIRASERCQ